MVVKFISPPLPLRLFLAVQLARRIRCWLPRDKRRVPSASLFLLKVFLENLQLLELLLVQTSLIMILFHILPHVLWAHFVLHNILCWEWRWPWSLASLYKPYGWRVRCLEIRVSHLFDFFSRKLWIYRGRFRDLLVLRDLLISEDVVGIALNGRGRVGIVAWV